jgi:hypothetical protein
MALWAQGDRAPAQAVRLMSTRGLGRLPVYAGLTAQQRNGRTFQCGEGWHSNENAVRLWIPSPRVPKETDARCYAFTTAYATMIPRCNVC